MVTKKNSEKYGDAITYDKILGNQKKVVKNMVTIMSSDYDYDDDGITYDTLSMMMLVLVIAGFLLGCLLIATMYCCWRFCFRNNSWLRKKLRKTRNVTEEGDLELLIQGPTVGGGAGAMAISLESLRRATHDFNATNIIGKGGSAIVYKGVLDGVPVAVKRLSKPNGISIDSSQFHSEFAALSKIRHRHLVDFLGYCLAENEKILVLEYMANGSLEDRLHKWQQRGVQPLEWKVRLRIALDVARGVEYLHSLACDVFIHRDLKTSNILLNDHLTAKVADFGLIRLIPEGNTSIKTYIAGTFGYMAPEIIATEGRVNTKVDVYSFGVILLELITGRIPLDNTRPQADQHLATWFVEKKVYKKKGLLIQFTDPSLQRNEKIEAEIQIIAKLAGQCVQKEPSRRPSMGHAVSVISPLVEEWKPLEESREGTSSGIGFHLSLLEQVKKWEAEDGASQLDSRFRPTLDALTEVDDEIEEEEDKKAAEERREASEKAAKKKERGKSSVLLDVKPWDDETDMKKLE